MMKGLDYWMYTFLLSKVWFSIALFRQCP
jgi:hypothetical protein